MRKLKHAPPPPYYSSPRMCLSGDKVMADEPLTCDLFRFLQLLCEGHNAGVYYYNTILLLLLFKLTYYYLFFMVFFLPLNFLNIFPTSMCFYSIIKWRKCLFKPTHFSHRLQILHVKKRGKGGGNATAQASL